jgi:hypothetical protein
MSRTIDALLVGVVMLLGPGCDKGSSTGPPTVPAQYSWEVRSETGQFAYGGGNSGSIQVDKGSLEVRDGKVTANGKDGGTLKPGDKVVLDKDGKLFVNGEERHLK